VVISARSQTADPMFFEMFGIDIGKARTVVVKSRGHFRAGFRPWFPPEQVKEIDTAGLTSPVLERLPFEGLAATLLSARRRGDLGARSCDKPVELVVPDGRPQVPRQRTKPSKWSPTYSKL